MIRMHNLNRELDESNRFDPQPADSEYWDTLRLTDEQSATEALGYPSHAEDIYAELDESERAEQFDAMYGIEPSDSFYSETF
jgi:uncharacterized tellurite resistance protein B-like protein